MGIGVNLVLNESPRICSRGKVTLDANCPHPNFRHLLKFQARASDSVYFLVYCVLALGPEDANSLKKVGLKGNPYSITARRVPELIPFLRSQPARDMSHKPDGRLPLLFARPAVTPATLMRDATNFAAWCTEEQWV